MTNPITCHKLKKQQREQENALRRERLIKISDFESLSLSVEEQYDRIRWLREIEAANLIAAVKRPFAQPEEQKTKASTNFNRPSWQDW